MTRRRRILLRCTAAFGAAVALFVALSFLLIDWPTAEAASYPGGVVLRDAAGEVLRVSLGPGDVDCRPYYAADPNDWIVKAVVAAEDGTYWTHGGVRPLSVLRALAQNLFFRRRISGASTITMQAVRLIHPHPKTYWWKWKEVVQAFKLERAHDKRWILSQYLNRAPYGSNLVGIESAAQGWFGKGTKELGLGEAALLAGMVQAPTRFRPDRGYAAAIKRRDYVLKRMVELGMISAEQCEGAKRVRPEVKRAPRPFRCPFFCDYVLQTLGDGAKGDVTTALDADIQAQVEPAVAASAKKGGYATAAVVVRVKTGEVVALACSGDYFDPNAGQVNTAVARRPAGSTLKPFLVAQAMDLGLVDAETLLDDSPKEYGDYKPANFDGRYRGPVSCRDALVLSLNLPFIRLLEWIGINSFGSRLQRLGFARLHPPFDDWGLGLAVGNCEVSLVELTQAYAKFARGGDEVFLPSSTRAVAEMLSGPERSGAAIGHVADVALPRFAWKTGTSSAYRDAWTVAWNPEYAIGVWCGHKHGGFGDETVVGIKAAAPVVWSIARDLYPNNQGPWF